LVDRLSKWLGQWISEVDFWACRFVERQSVAVAVADTVGIVELMQLAGKRTEGEVAALVISVVPEAASNLVPGLTCPAKEAL
jgi:hypothetical protein